MSAADLLRDVVRGLDAAGIPHMLVGSFASTSHGAPRTTQDIDIVIDPSVDALDRFVAGLDRDRLYVSPSASESLVRRSQFNLCGRGAGGGR